MKTECVRCHKVIDTVQGYKFSATEYVCMSCYDEFKAERAAKLKKQQKSSLLEQYGAEPSPDGRSPSPERAPSPPRPAEQPAQRVAPGPAQPAPQQPPSQPQAPRPAPPERQMFAPKAPPQTAPPPGAAPGPVASKPSPTADVCDVCQKPIPDFKVPLQGGKKVCMGCNEILRSLAKTIMLDIQCPHCGKDIQFTEK